MTGAWKLTALGGPEGDRVGSVVQIDLDRDADNYMAASRVGLVDEGGGPAVYAAGRPVSTLRAL